MYSCLFIYLTTVNFKILSCPSLGLENSNWLSLGVGRGSIRWHLDRENWADSSENRGKRSPGTGGCTGHPGPSTCSVGATRHQRLVIICDVANPHGVQIDCKVNFTCFFRLWATGRLVAPRILCCRRCSEPGGQHVWRGAALGSSLSCSWYVCARHEGCRKEQEGAGRSRLFPSLLISEQVRSNSKSTFFGRT